MVDTGDLLTGSTFGGYRIERLLGRGGMGAVYAAEQIEDGRRVAVKVLSSSLTADADRERFLREGTTAASINHPNTVYVYRTEEINGTPTITMELVDGETLEDKVARLGPLSVAEAVKDTLQIVDGLDAAHRLGILHRDIKPANCFVGPSGEVKVGDFGLSRPVDEANHSRLTQTGLFLGTPVFSSPEQLTGEALDLRADIYAVGATLYYLLSGKLPYDAHNVVQLIAVVMSGAVTPLSKHRSDLPAALHRVVMKCLARRREDRFADYAALREALVACQPNEMLAAPIGRRLAAGLLDLLGITAISTPFSVAVASLADIDVTRVWLDQSARSSLIQLGFELPVFLLWFGVLEGRWGWSPGKLLAGTRVIRVGGGTPGMARGCARALLLWSLYLPSAAAQLAGSTERERATLSVVVWFVAFALLFARARLRNGYAGEHDRLTDTRVVRHKTVSAPPRSPEHDTSPAPLPSSDATTIGPYQVLGRLPSSANVLVGFDPHLRRTTWIMRRSPDAPPFPRAEREAVRSGCVRWIGGRRSATESWDAFAAIPGYPLRERLSRSAEWSDIHGWLNDLVSEVMERDDPAGQLSQLTVDHVWISEDGPAILLSLPMVRPDVAVESTATLLLDLVRAVGSMDDGLLTRDLWPFRARTVLRDIEARPTDLHAIRRILDDAAVQTGGMTRERRLWLWAAVAVPMVLLMGVMLIGGLLVLDSEDRDHVRMEPLLHFLRRKHDTADSTVARRELVAIYLAGHFRGKITGRPKDDAGKILSTHEWRISDSVVAAHPVIPADRLLAADRLVDSTWHGVPPGSVSRRGFGFLLFAPIIAVLLGAGALSIGAALTVRRGLAMRSLGLEIATRRGERAGRARLVWRQLVIWLPAVVLCVLTFIVLLGDFTPKVLGAATVAIGFILTAVVVAIRAPGRGLAERLSGTIIVPE